MECPFPVTETTADQKPSRTRLPPPCSFQSEPSVGLLGPSAVTLAFIDTGTDSDTVACLLLSPGSPRCCRGTLRGVHGWLRWVLRASEPLGSSHFRRLFTAKLPPGIDSARWCCPHSHGAVEAWREGLGEGSAQRLNWQGTKVESQHPPSFRLPPSLWSLAPEGTGPTSHASKTPTFIKSEESSPEPARWRTPSVPAKASVLYKHPAVLHLAPPSAWGQLRWVVHPQDGELLQPGPGPHHPAA